MFSFWGYHCDTQNNLYKVSTLNVLTNFKLMNNIPEGDQLQSGYMESQTMGNSLIGSRCVVKDINGTYYFQGSVCTNCNETITTIETGSYHVCSGDTYRINDEDKPFYKRWLCTDDGGMGYCDIPKNFFFNQTLGLYQCQDLDVCGNYTSLNKYDDQLREKGELIRDRETSLSYDDAFSVKCEELKPEFQFFKIPIFNYKLWIFAIVLMAMLTMVSKVSSM